MTPLPEMLAAFFLRELRTLRAELERYPDDGSLWALPAGLPNSGGTLALHLAGNVQHYVGARLGSTGYVRDRAREFSARGLSVAEVLREVAAAEEAVRHTLPRLTGAQLDADFPEAIRGSTLRTGEYLVQTAVHLAYHLGQLSYHRRLVTGDPTGVGAVAAPDLGFARPEPPA